MLRWRRPGPGAWDVSQGHKKNQQEGLKVIQSVTKAAQRCDAALVVMNFHKQILSYTNTRLVFGMMSVTASISTAPELKDTKPDYLFLIGLWPVIKIKFCTYFFIFITFHHLLYHTNDLHGNSPVCFLLHCRQSFIFNFFLSFIYVFFFRCIKIVLSLSCSPCVSPGQMDSPWPPWSDLWVQSKTAGIRRPCYNRRAPTRLLCWSSWGPAGTGSWWGPTTGQMEQPWWKTPWASARRPRKNDNTPCAETKGKAGC